MHTVQVVRYLAPALVLGSGGATGATGHHRRGDSKMAETQICPFLGKICIGDKCRMWDYDGDDCIVWAYYNNLDLISEILVKEAK